MESVPRFRQVRCWHGDGSWKPRRPMSHATHGNYRALSRLLLLIVKKLGKASHILH